MNTGSTAPDGETVESKGGREQILASAVQWQRLARLVQEVHADGKLHLQAGPEWIAQWITKWGIAQSAKHATEQRELELPSASKAVVLSTAMLPPELDDLGELLVEPSIAATDAQLTGLRKTLDPRRIDIFNLGRSYCQLLANVDAEEYLRSPSVKSRIPPELRVILDSCLGYEPAKRFTTCREVLSALETLGAAGEGAAGEGDAVAAGEPHGETAGSEKASSGAHDAADVVAMDDSPGRDRTQELPFQTLGHYQITQRIGSGGMGDVYRADDPTLDRTVALKVLAPSLSRHDEFVDRFTTEAKAIAKLSHPNIVPVYFTGVEGKSHYFVMQYVDGPTLAEVLAEQGPLTPASTLRLAGQIVGGLADAHRHGLIHRDIKPGNVLIDRDRQIAMLSDFGLVKSLGSDPQSSAGIVMGTVEYISPEQGQGKVIDERSDLYSVGVLLFQCLSGRLPFSAENPASMIFQHVYEDPPLLSDIAPQVGTGLSTIVQRLLRKDPAERFQSAADLQAALNHLESEVASEGSGFGSSGLPSADSSVELLEVVGSSTVQPGTVLPRTEKYPAFRTSTRTVSALAIAAVLVGVLAVAMNWKGEPSPKKEQSLEKEQSLKVEQARTKDERARVPVTIGDRLSSLQWTWSEPKNLGPLINTKRRESSPWVSEDELTLLFSSDRSGGQGDLDIWISRRTAADLDWGPPENLGPSINSSAMDICPSLTADGCTLVFGSRRGHGTHKGDIFISQRNSIDDPWGSAVKMTDTINTEFNEWHPRMTPDGLTIYFSSNRYPTYGYNDLWKTTRPSLTSPWQTPEDLGKIINTASGELDAWPAADGTAIVFASRRPSIHRRPGIFLSTRTATNEDWQQPESLGPIVNKTGEEAFGFLSVDGESMWFVSPRKDGYGRTDIYVTHRVASTENR